MLLFETMRSVIISSDLPRFRESWQGFIQGGGTPWDFPPPPPPPQKFECNCLKRKENGSDLYISDENLGAVS